MVLFRHISARERGERYRPRAATLLGAGFLAIACLLILDSFA
jgi:hypothetical protein